MKDLEIAGYEVTGYGRPDREAEERAEARSLYPSIPPVVSRLRHAIISKAHSHAHAKNGSAALAESTCPGMG